MTYEVREGQGALFVNDRKEGDQPDYRGNVRIGGVLYRVSGWRRESGGGKRWLSLAIQLDQPRGERTEKAQERRAATPPSQAAESGLDDDIPF